MSECTLDENLSGSGCKRCTSELAELRRYRTFILDLAHSLESNSLSHTDAANEVLDMAALIEEVGSL